MSSNVTVAGLSGSKQILKKCGLLREPFHRFKTTKEPEPQIKGAYNAEKNWYSTRNLL